MKAPSLKHIEQKLWLVEEKTGFSRYDFDFETFLRCEHPAWLDGPVCAVARMGAAPDYAERFSMLEQFDITLVHSPEEYDRTSLLPEWYPLIEDLTPRSVWFEEQPEAEAIEAVLDYPIFLKGERQTSKHDRSMAIIETPEQMRQVLARWSRDPILHWQRVVARDYIPLRPVARDHGAGLPHVFEFRSFWWEDACVELGPYWVNSDYAPNVAERGAAVALGQEVARRIGVTFLTIDLAQTIDGDWIVIECNDGQDSGYMGCKPLTLWRNVLDKL
jgi:hypothetical protein